MYIRILPHIGGYVKAGVHILSAGKNRWGFLAALRMTMPRLAPYV